MVKMISLGIGNREIKMIAKCLRNTFIKVDETVVKTFRGVPQGSRLSPALFNIYIEDLLVQLKPATSGVLAYADDLAFVTEGKSTICKAIVIVEEWCKGNDMEVNKPKSAVLVITEDERTRESGAA